MLVFNSVIQHSKKLLLYFCGANIVQIKWVHFKVLILEGNQEIQVNVHVWINLCYLILFLHACAACSELHSDIGAMGKTVEL